MALKRHDIESRTNKEILPWINYPPSYTYLIYIYTMRIERRKFEHCSKEKTIRNCTIVIYIYIYIISLVHNRHVSARKGKRSRFVENVFVESWIRYLISCCSSWLPRNNTVRYLFLSSITLRLIRLLPLIFPSPAAFQRLRFNSACTFHLNEFPHFKP